MNGACNGNFFLSQPPWALGRGQKVKYHLISITKSISKIFIPNPACVLTNERYKIYQDEIFILSPGSCLRGGTWGTGVPKGSKNYWGYHGGLGSKRFFSEIQPDLVCELLT